MGIDKTLLSTDQKYKSLKNLKALYSHPHPVRWSGHKAKVHALAWSPQGDKLASGSVDKTVRVYSTENVAKIQSMPTSNHITAHSGSVEKLVWNPMEPATLATASTDKTVRVWDMRDGKLACCIKTVGENINIAWSPNGQYVAVGNKKDLLTLLDMRKLQTLKMKQFAHEVNEFEWEPSSKYMFLTTDKGTLEVYDNQLERKHTLWAHPSNIYALQFDKTNQHFACGSADALVSLFRMPEMICIQSFGYLEKPVRTLSFSYDSAMIAAASEESSISVVHVDSGDQVAKIGTNAPINNVAFHPSEHLLAYAGDDKDRMGQDEGCIHIVRPNPTSTSATSSKQEMSPSSSSSRATIVTSGGSTHHPVPTKHYGSSHSHSSYSYAKSANRYTPY